MSQKVIGFIAVLILGSCSASADVIQHYLVEPYLGSGQATTNVVVNPKATIATPLGPNIASFQLAGMGYGIRLGVELSNGIVLAGDYLSTSVSGSGLSELPGDVGAMRKLNLATMGALLGYHVPSTPFRFWFEYLFYASGSDVESYNKGQVETGSSGYKIGVGYFLNPYITLNLEYADISLSRSTLSYQSFTYFYDNEVVRLAMIDIGIALGAILVGR